MKSSTDNCSARKVSKCSISFSFIKVKGFNAFLKVFLLWLYPVFTTRLNFFSSTVSSFLLFLTNFITPDFTFGGGVNTSSFTVKQYSMS